MRIFSANNKGIGIFKVALFTSFIYSMNPWFLWSLGNYSVILSVVLFLFTLFHRKELYLINEKRLLSFFILVILHIYLLLIKSDVTILTIIFSILNICVFGFIIFSRDACRIVSLQFIAKLLACISLVSIFGLILFFLGFNFSPNVVDYNEGQYEYYNYYFFLVDLKTIVADKWRFSGYFLEPAHIGVASTVLLISQNYNFRKWYNLILLLTVIISFSLAAYVLFIFGLYVKLLLSSKHFVLYTFILLFISMIVVLIALNYEQGDNFFNKYIFERLSFEDGEMVGNYRVSHGFKQDFERFMDSNKIWFGTEYNPNRYEGGNAGYRVYIYQNGLIGLLLIIIFYVSLIPAGTPVFLTLFLLLLNVLIFWKGGTPLWYNLIIPYLFSFSSLKQFYVRK